MFCLYALFYAAINCRYCMTIAWYDVWWIGKDLGGSSHSLTEVLTQHRHEPGFSQLHVTRPYHCTNPFGSLIMFFKEHAMPLHMVRIQLTTSPPSCAQLSWNLGVSTSWNPQGLSRHVMGLLYFYLYLVRVAVLSIRFNATICQDFFLRTGCVYILSLYSLGDLTA